ncbi:MAG: hydrogenase expression/formation C-terminal domain-containing protein [Rhodomicrobium sp.]
MTTIFQAHETVESTATDGEPSAMLAALFSELRDLLRRFLDIGERGSVDLFKLPMSPADLHKFKDRLGRGEVSIALDVAGNSEIYETAYAGIWWVQHEDELGRVVARLIEVADVPNIVRTHRKDLEVTVKTLLCCLPGKEGVS